MIWDRWRHLSGGRLARPVHIAASPYKTGTTSLGRALIGLGVGHREMPYSPAVLRAHRRVIARYNKAANRSESAAAFLEAHGADAVAELRGFTRALAPYDVFPDAPFGHNHLHPFLQKALAPRARFIWVNRDIPDWVASVRRWEEGHPEVYPRRVREWQADPRQRRRALRRTWQKRHARFLQLAEAFPGDCLEVHLSELDTMDPLCRFYGLEETGQPFPRRNIGSRDG